MVPKNDAFIWGAGKWGRLAYACYRNSWNIVGYIDKNETLSGTVIKGVPVYSPDILKKQSANIIIAVKHGVNEIKKTLREEYGIQEAAVFRILMTYEDTNPQLNARFQESELIVKFQGGLGNQMFQYALYKIYQKQGKNVVADLSSYFGIRSSSRNFRLLDIFPFANIKKSSPLILFYYEQCADNENNKVEQYLEPILPEIVFNQKILKMKTGIVEGYFQSYKYPELTKRELMKEFSFPFEKNPSLNMLLNRMTQQECVAVHIRRGDYTKLVSMYGALWNETYYARAINWIKSQVSNPVFLFFSDDIEWTKEHFQEKDAIYIEPHLFNQYEDWYDMCLMSHCKHNIIANSTFSWWGAWLNSNPDKIVIAPRKWMKDDVMQDVCPPDWIRL